MPATAVEQMILELINRARLDPAAEAARDGIDLNEGLPAGTISTASKQPLAMNEVLLSVARGHSSDMLARQYFAHNTPDNPPVTPDQRISAAGYSYSWWGENIAWQGTTGTVTNAMSVDLERQLFVDAGVDGRGHRTNLMNANFQEVGAGVENGSFMGYNGTLLTEDFGKSGSQQFLTGVSYTDTDHDNFYSIGEGRNGVTVAVAGGPSGSTAGAGGYALSVAAGVRNVTFSGGGLAAPVSVAVTVTAGTNAMVDMVDQGVIYTSASLTDLGGATKIVGLGTLGLNLVGDSGPDTFIGTKGNDTIQGGGGTDTVDFSGARSAYTLTDLGGGSVRVTGPDGTDTLSSIEQLVFTDQTVTWGTSFADPFLAVSNFGATNAGGGWSSDDTYPRVLGDVNGDGLADIIGFGGAGAFVSLATGGGHFADPFLAVSNFGATNAGGGWSSDTTYPREVADVNGDGLADIVGFGGAGAYVSLATGGGHFADPFLAVSNFGATNTGGGWSSDDTYPRVLGDVNGDGLADIIGFGGAGVYVSLATGGGHFANPFLAVSNFGATNAGGGWTSDTTYPREVADVNGDGLADIVGFGGAGVYVSLATGGGHFADPFLAVSNFGATNAGGGWGSDDTYPRVLGDLNGDGLADIIGFGGAGAYVSLATGGGHFADPTLDVSNFGASNSGGGWTSQNLYPRTVADVTGDHHADIVGFGGAGVFVSTHA